jgi:IS30 family transposase
MGSVKHGRCRRGVRPSVGSVGRPTVGQREDRQLFWRSISKGLTSEKAGVLAGVSSVVGVRWFRQGGGMPNVSFAPLSARFLSFAEREEIALLHAQGHGIREIARQIDRHPSTVSRELRRNAATRSGYLEYRASTAQWHAQRRARRPKEAKLASNLALRRYVHERLAGAIETDGGQQLGPRLPWTGRRHGQRQDRHWARSWSPEQIANRLRLDFPQNKLMRISHEAIYQALYIHGRAALPRELSMCLRSGHPLRVPRARSRSRGKQFVTPEVMISQRPALVDHRKVAGHWEGDLILGLDKSAIGTLESARRASRCCCTFLA